MVGKTKHDKDREIVREHLPIFLTAGFALFYAAYVLRVAHGDVPVAVTLVREQGFESLIAFLPALLDDMIKGPRYGIASVLIVFGLWQAYGRGRERALGTMLISAAILIVLVARFSWRMLLVGIVLAALVWLPTSVVSRVPADARLALQFALAIVVLLLVVWRFDEPWIQSERLWVSAPDGSTSDDTFCTGWVLGEQANGRWLIFLTYPSRSVVAVETSIIWKRKSLTTSERNRVVAAYEPGTVTYTTLTDEELKKGCPGDLIDPARLAAARAHATTTATSTTTALK
jgi:hypothetical protein